MGQLNHTAYVLPNARHFLSRIRVGLGLTTERNRNRRRTLKISPEAMEDLALWEEYLTNAHSGVSLNLLVTREPDKVCWSDCRSRGRAVERYTPLRSRRPSERQTNRAFLNLVTIPGTGELCHLSAARNNSILDNASSSSRRIVFDGRQEGSNEVYDRTWRQCWGYCEHIGYSSDPYLTLLSIDKQELFLRAFLDFYRSFNWDAHGKPSGSCQVPVIKSPAPPGVIQHAPLCANVVEGMR